MAGKIGFEFQLTQPRSGAKQLDESSPLRILVMADLSGRAGRGLCSPAELGSRPIVSIDVDNSDRVMTRLAPSVQVLAGSAAAAGVTFEPRTIDDFHPDQIFRSQALFQELRATRARLQNPQTFAEAAASLRMASPPTPNAAPVESPASSAARPEDDGAMLARLLGGTPPAQTAPTPSDPIKDLIRKVVAPHIVPDAPPFQAQYVASVEAAIADQMRAFLHDPALQALEAAWRGVHLLASGLETGEQIKLAVLDVTGAELAADMTSAQGNPERSQLYRRLVEQGARATGGEPWSLIVGAYSFGASAEDVELLGCLGAVASRAGGPFLAAADASLAGCESLVTTPDPNDWQPLQGETAALWGLLRSSAIAPWIGLALPRVLQRLPYGKKSDPVQSLDFEELAPNARHDDYLWGNPAFACALLIGRAFTERGPEMEPGDLLDVEDLPAHIVERDGEKRMQACAELFLTERAGDALIARGLIPLLSYRNRNAARVMRFQSIAKPQQPLSGPWGA